MDGRLLQVAGLASADDKTLTRKVTVSVDFIFPGENCVWVCFHYTMQTHKE